MRRTVLTVVAGAASLSLSAALLAVAAPAAGAAPAVARGRAATTGGYAVRALTGAFLPYSVLAPIPKVDTQPHDATGVRMYPVAGVLHDHPVAQAQYGLLNLDSYRVSGDRFYLDRAVAQAQRILSHRVVSGGAWFYPYDFTFARHQNPADGVQRPPWFSAMAQGQALSLFTRLFEVTGDASYRTAADLTFRSFLATPSPRHPWVVEVDAKHNLWLVEFPLWPMAQSDLALNGHVFASYGLYDYFELTHDARARRIWDAALHTVAVMVPTVYRNPGWISNYCVAHGHPSARYHAVHIDELLHLHAMTGDVTFARLADELSDDYPAPREAGTAILGAGVRTAYLFTSRGVVQSQISRRLGTAISVIFDRRQRIKGRGVYYRIATGTFAGRWIQEQPRAAVARMPVGVEHYLLTRRALVRRGVLTGIRVDDSGLATVVRARYAAATRFAVDQRGWVRGVLSVRLSGGALDGVWVAVSSVTFV